MLAELWLTELWLVELWLGGYGPAGLARGRKEFVDARTCRTVG